MSRIQLRDTTIYLEDGLAGTCDVDDAGGVPIGTDTVTIDAVVLNTDDTALVPVGARFTFAGDPTIYSVVSRIPVSTSPTTDLTFTPLKVSPAAVDDDVITVINQRLAIKIGEGDLTWTEARNFEYDLDRDQLDTVRQGEDVPMTVDLNFTFEEVTASNGKPPTPVDALKRKGEASEWVSSSSDLCEPYAVDIYVINDIKCGTQEDEDYRFPDFRYESLDFSIADATIAVSGSCNATEAIETRAPSIT